mgnify:CR=1 FL=1
MTPHRVIHVITRLDYGGSAQNTMLTVLGHDKERFTPIVVAGAPGRWDAQGGQAAMDDNCRRLDRSGITWHLIPTLVRPIKPLSDLRALWALVRLFRQEKPALVHTHTSKAGVLGRVAAWIARVPAVIHTPHGHVFYGHFGPVMTRLFLQVERVLSRVTHRLIALTESERDDHLDRKVGQAARFAVIPSGIDLDRFRQPGGTVRCKPAVFPCPANAIVVGSVGWLTDIKGHRYLIEAFGQIARDVPSAHLVVVGSGDLKEHLLDLATTLGVRDRVHLIGHRDDVEVCLTGMDLFVLPSLNEGMGRALIEAMAAGLPVVASQVGGVPALIEHERTGLLVPPADSHALAASLRSLLERPDLRRQLGEAGRRSVTERFAAEAMVRALEQLYQETLLEVGAW